MHLKHSSANLTAADAKDDLAIAIRTLSRIHLSTSEGLLRVRVLAASIMVGNSVLYSSFRKKKADE